MVKSQKAEALLPAFDIGRKVGGKIRLQRHRRAVVLCVVDVADFDGSLPRAALQARTTGLCDAPHPPFHRSLCGALSKWLSRSARGRATRWRTVSTPVSHSRAWLIHG